MRVSHFTFQEVNSNMLCPVKNYSSLSPTPTEQIPVCMLALMKTWLKMIAGDTGGEITHSQHASDCENSSLFTTSLPPCVSLSHPLF